MPSNCLLEVVHLYRQSMFWMHNEVWMNVIGILSSIPHITSCFVLCFCVEMTIISLLFRTVHTRCLCLCVYIFNAFRFLSWSSDVHRLHPGGGEPLPAAPRPVRPAGRGDVQPTPPRRNLPTHLRHRQRVLPLAVEEAAEPVCPDQVGDLDRFFLFWVVVAFESLKISLTDFTEEV